MSDELKRAYELVQQDLMQLEVYVVHIYGDGTVELSTTWETDTAALGGSFFDAVKVLRRGG